MNHSEDMVMAQPRNPSQLNNVGRNVRDGHIWAPGTGLSSETLEEAFQPPSAVVPHREQQDHLDNGHNQIILDEEEEGGDDSDQEEHRADVLPAQPPKQPGSLADHLFYVVTEPAGKIHVNSTILINIICSSILQNYLLTP